MISIKNVLRLLSFFSIFLVGALQIKAQISASVTQGCAPLIGVQFSHSFTGATNINWSFGNGSSSTGANPTNTYQQPGVYQVVFTADPGIQETLTITVLASPTANFSVVNESTGCLPLLVSFQDNSTVPTGSNIVNWSWDFGDGGFLVGNFPSPNHLYTLTGINDVTLVVEDDNGCSSSISIPDLVVTSTPPNLSLVSSPSNTSACNPPLTVDFSANASSNSPDTDVLTYEWVIDGEISNVVNPAALTYTEDGTYPISVTVTDDAGCSSTEETAVFIGSPQADWELIGGPLFCDSVYFENLSDPANTSIDWGIGPNENIFNPEDTLLHVYSTPGEYTATITTSSPGCSSSDEVTFTIEEVVADFVSSPNFTCNPELEVTYTSTSVGAETYSWIIGGVEVGDEPEIQYTHVAPGSIDPYAVPGPALFGITLFITSAAGCEAHVSHFNDTIWLPHADFAIDIDDGCAPLTVTFSDSSSAPSPIVNYAWHMGNGTIINSPLPNATSYTYTTDGDFEPYLVITTAEGCTDTSFFALVEVGIPTSPEVEFGPLQVCPNEPVDFSAVVVSGDGIDMWSIQTDNNQMSGCPYDPDVSGGLNSYAGFHDVTIMTSYNGCISSTTYTDAIEVLGPVAHINSILNCEDPFTVEFEGDITGADSWTFDFGDGNSTSSSSEQSVSHTYAQTGDYLVFLTAEGSAGCPPFQDSVLVKIRDIHAELSQPGPTCAGDGITLSAVGSIDVHAANNDGYAWVFGPQMGVAPQRTEDSFIDFSVDNSGIHNVSLIVYDENRCTDTAYATVAIYDVDAALQYEALGDCLPLEFEFWDVSSTDTTVASWQWNFDGLGSSTDSSSSFTFQSNSSPPFSIGLVVTDVLGCSDDATVNINLDLPSATFSANNLQMCAGEDVVFTAANQNYPYYEWNIGNGSTTPDDPSFTSSYLDQGLYDITLVVQNDLGCSDTLTIPNYIAVQAYPDVGFSTNVDDMENLCYPILIEFTDTTNAWIFDYREWDLGTGFPVVDNVSVGTIYDTPGTYNVSLEVGTTFGCIGTYERVFNIEGPVADFVMSDNELCLYEPLSLEMTEATDVSYFTWEFGDGQDSAMVNPVTYLYSQIPTGGTTNVQLITWSADSICSATTEYPLTLNYTLADFNRNGESVLEDTVHCFGIPDTMTNFSINATNYNWRFGNGYITTAENPVYTYPVGGEYNVRLIASNSITGCSDTLIKPMVIYPEMVVSAPNGLACEGDTIYLSAYGGETYQWFPPEAVNDPNSQFPFLTAQENSELSVMVTDTNSCSTSVDLIADYIYPAILPTWSDTTIDFGTVLDFSYNEEPYEIHSWFYANGGTCETCSLPIFTPDDNNVYGVSVTDELTCFVDTFFFTVTVLDDLLFFMPNAFTPNADGINDNFYPVITRALPRDYEFTIYNRYGELIWRTNEITDKWQGNLQGSAYHSQTEVYVWKVRVYDLRSIAHEFMGSVTLVR